MNLASFIGIPFEIHGRTMDGCDCWGLVRLYYLDTYNIDLPLYHENYTTLDDQETISKAIIGGKSDWVETEPEIGLVVLTRVANRSTHLGVLVGLNMMLHTSEKVGSHIVRLTSSLWSNRVIGFFKYA